MNFHKALDTLGPALNKNAGVEATYKRGDVEFPVTVNVSVIPVEDLFLRPRIPVSCFFQSVYMERSDFVVDGTDYFPPQYNDKITLETGTFRVVGRQGQYELTALMSSDATSVYDWTTAGHKRIVMTVLKEA